jgi:hypothetical protein
MSTRQEKQATAWHVLKGAVPIVLKIGRAFSKSKDNLNKRGIYAGTANVADLSSGDRNFGVILW